LADEDKFSQDELSNLMKMLQDAGPAKPPAGPAPKSEEEPPGLPLPPPLAPKPAPVPPPKPVQPAPPAPPAAAAPPKPVQPAPPAPPAAAAPPKPVQPTPPVPPAAAVSPKPVPPPAAPAAEAPPPPPPPAPQDIHGSQEPIARTPEMLVAEDIARQFEVCRVHMEQVLTPFIGEKVAKKMLSWSLDRASKTNPVLKNVHWSMSGDLLDNGSIDAERLLRNFEHFPGVDAVGLVKKALSELLAMRLGAIEQGLGSSMRSAIEKDVLRLEEILK